MINQDLPDHEVDETIDTDSAKSRSDSAEFAPTISPGQAKSDNAGAELPVADQTGRYELKDEIARGGMGVVVLGKELAPNAGQGVMLVDE